MPEPTKRTIKVKPILADLRSGVEPAALRVKYDLSDRELKAVLDKLVSVGAISAGDKPGDTLRAQLRSNASPERPVELSKLRREKRPHSQGSSTTPPVRCPQCGALKESLSAPCPQCGAGRTGSLLRDAPGIPLPKGERRHVSRASKPLESSSSNPWVTIGITMFIFAVIGVGLLAISSHRTDVSAERHPSVSATGPGSIRRFTVENFQTDVVEASRNKPVLVEFYADW